MLTVTHVTVGAALGTVLAASGVSPIIAFVAGLTSHYVLDAIPHWERVYRPHDEPDFEITQGVAYWPKFILLQAVVDVVLGFVILATAVAVYASETSTVVFVLATAIGAALPDILDNVPFWNKKLRKLPLFAQEYALHVRAHISPKRQKQFPSWLGLWTQILLVAASVVVLIAYAR